MSEKTKYPRSFTIDEAKEILRNYTDLVETLASAIINKSEVAEALFTNKNSLNTKIHLKKFSRREVKVLIELAETNPEYFNGC